MTDRHAGYIVTLADRLRKVADDPAWRPALRTAAAHLARVGGIQPADLNDQAVTDALTAWMTNTGQQPSGPDSLPALIARIQNRPSR